MYKEIGFSRAWPSEHRKAVRAEDTGHVSKLCIKTLFTSENFHSLFRSFLCIVRNFIILHSYDVVLGHFGKTGVYAGYCFIIHFPEGGHSISIYQTSEWCFLRALIGSLSRNIQGYSWLA